MPENTGSPLTVHGTDRVDRSADDSVLLTCSFSKGWRPRQSGTQTRAAHPGTAVRWDGAVFEVLAAEPLPDGGTRYRLVPWDSRHAIRVLDPYDAASEARRRDERAALHRSVRWRWMAILLSPILGHLPGDVQYRLETEHGAPANAMTIVSAIPFLVVGVLGLLSGVLFGFGADLRFDWLPPLPICAWFAAESALRIGSAWVQGRPMGSLGGVLLYRTGEWAFAKKPVPTARPRPRGAAGAEADEKRGQAARDRFLVLEPILSLLPETDQRDLEDRFGFDWRRWGKWTEGILFVAGALNVLASLAMMAGHVAGTADAVWLLAGSAICAEQAWRWKGNQGGKPRGSILGTLVRPFALSLLTIG